MQKHEHLLSMGDVDKLNGGFLIFHSTRDGQIIVFFSRVFVPYPTKQENKELSNYVQQFTFSFLIGFIELRF